MRARLEAANAHANANALTAASAKALAPPRTRAHTLGRVHTQRCVIPRKRAVPPPWTCSAPRALPLHCRTARKEPWTCACACTDWACACTANTCPWS
eukprot:5510990-Pleurochrysis_carterae.AAC.1